MKLMILDGNSIINRAFYGVRLLSTKDGVYTNAIYGFLNILERLRADEQPDALCVAFDLKAPTFRHLAYDGYKATRHPMPEELAMQMPLMKEVLGAMNIPIYECEGWEADDILGTAGEICAREGADCVIVTGDRDSLQLVTDRVTVKLVTSKSGQTITTNYTPDVFRAEYGFDPVRLVDLKSLMGDSSDNIPGVAGIGPKTATSLLLEYGTLDGIYEHLPEIKESVRKKLEKDREQAYLSYDLATIRKNAPVDFVPERNLVREVDNDALYALFHRLEFTRLIARYGLHVPQEAPKPQEKIEAVCTCEAVTDAARAREIATRLSKERYVNLAVSEDLSKIAVQLEDAGFLFSGEAVLDNDFMSTMFGASVKKVTHDCKSLMRTLLERGFPADGFIFDTALAAYDLDATRGDYKLDDVFSQYCGAQIGYADEARIGKEAAEETALLAQAAAVAALYAVLPGKLRECGMEKLYYEIELPLCAVLARMETRGVLVDQMALVAFGNMLELGIEKDQADIFRYAGQEFNINSPKQLGEVLFERLGLPPVKKTKSGYSTNAEVLEKLKSRHPIIEAILDYRTLTKLKSTYADGLVKEIADDGRIHTTFQNMVTATGRLSSTEPNLQNIPVRTELGSEIRKMFVPKDGWVFVDADYSQIELRVLAHIAEDAHMQAAFTSGMDIHTATAAQVFHVAPEDVTPLMRRHAKAVNFGIVYGISEFSLAEDIGVTRKEAKAYIENYLQNYAGVREYMKNIVAQAKQDGFVTTMFGRRRNLPELKSSNFNIRSFGERVALNTPIQGTAADIIKLAMIHVDKALREQKLQARLVLQVHDELIVECPIEEREQVTALLTEQMEHVAKLSVPLLAEAKSGASWYEAK
jgi:DNA polymerase-1